jgi:probable HAF family extracellular repeat protein
VKSKLTPVLCIGLIPLLFGIAFPAEAAPKQSTGITYNATLLNIPAGSIANGINDVGQIVGQYGPVVSNENLYGFIYKFTEEPLMTLITNTLSDGAVNTQAYGINNAGQVVGATATGNGTYGFLYDGGNFTNFSVPSGSPVTIAFGINSTGQIVGYGQAGGYNEGFLYLGSTVDVLKVPGAEHTVAYGINSTCEIVGFSQGTRTSGFIYNNGVYTVINFPGSTFTQLRAINDLGQIVGTYIDASGNNHPFMYEKGNYDEITVLLGGQAFGPQVNGINKAGQIVGVVSTSNCNGCAFVADPVVKPKTH